MLAFGIAAFALDIDDLFAELTDAFGDPDSASAGAPDAGRSGSAPPPGSSAGSEAGVWQTDAGQALEILDGLSIAEHVEVAYGRVEQFGRSWPDHAGTGCDERNTILARDLVEITLDQDGCTVRSGRLDPDPYTGQVIDFLRGPETSPEVQIDHLVPLRWAAGQGALEWAQERRLEFANDPANLIAVDGPANAAKGHSGPDGWLPSSSGNPTFDCEYVAQFVTVVDAYEMPIPARDAHAAQAVLEEC